LLTGEQKRQKKGVFQTKSEQGAGEKKKLEKKQSPVRIKGEGPRQPKHQRSDESKKSGVGNKVGAETGEGTGGVNNLVRET